MRTLISMLMIAAITAALAACGAATWMDVDVGTDRGGAGVGTRMGATTTISAAAAIPPTTSSP